MKKVVSPEMRAGKIEGLIAHLFAHFFTCISFACGKTAEAGDFQPQIWLVDSKILWSDS